MSISFFLPHIENDEVIYQALAKKISKKPFDYSIQGTEILSQLPKAQYDYPVFRHPPLFILLLALIYKILGVKFGIFIPILSGLFTIFIGFLIAKRIFSLKEAIVTAAILAFCPILFFASTKVWIDTTYVSLMCLSFYVFICAYERQNYLITVFSGAIFGLAILTKYPSLGIAPAILMYAYFKRNSFKDFFLRLFLFSITAFLITLPWLYYYRKAMGGFTYAAHFKTTPEFVEMFPFVKMTFERPDYFYLQQLVIVTPVYLFSIFYLLSGLKKKENVVLLIWILSFLAGFIILFKLNIVGYTFRFLLPITVPLAVLSARAIIKWEKFLLPLGIIFIFYQLIAGILSSYIFYSADIFSIFYFLKR